MSLEENLETYLKEEKEKYANEEEEQTQKQITQTFEDLTRVNHQWPFR